ncbi:MAG: hypothetical protein ACK5GN_03535 [Pseudomonadota bacterium]|jgi:hypothetical protein
MSSGDEEIIAELKRSIAELLEEIAAHPRCPAEARDEIEQNREIIDDLKR